MSDLIIQKSALEVNTVRDDIVKAIMNINHNRQLLDLLIENYRKLVNLCLNDVDEDSIRKMLNLYHHIPIKILDDFKHNDIDTVKILAAECNKLHYAFQQNLRQIGDICYVSLNICNKTSFEMTIDPYIEENDYDLLTGWYLSNLFEGVAGIGNRKYSFPLKIE